MTRRAACKQTMGQTWSDEEGSIEALKEVFDAHFELLKPISHRLFERFTVRPYGVLGVGDSGAPRKQPSAAIDAVVVDPAGSREVSLNKPAGAFGASRRVYEWLGLDKRGARYPQEVSARFGAVNSAECQAVYHRYGPGRHVIHAVGPVLRELDQSIRDLTEIYAAVFREFCHALGCRSGNGNAAASSNNWASSNADVPRTLRLLPISTGGLFENKHLAPFVGRIFWTSVAIALERLPRALQMCLQTATIEVCIFKASEFKLFEDAFEVVQGAVELTQESGRLAARHGSYDWVRKHNSPTDRVERLAASALTMQAVWCKGYYLPNGRAVGLKHTDAMVANTSVRRANELLPARRGYHPTTLSMENGTVTAVAARLAHAGKMVAAVNAASAYHVGGGVLTGGRHALEEAWCMTSTLLKSLQEAQAAAGAAGELREIHTNAAGHHFCKYLPEDGVVVSPMVEVFRDDFQQGYVFLEHPAVLCGVVSVAMYNRNPRMKDCPVDAPQARQAYDEGVRRKLRAAVAAAVEVGADVLVCPAVGCGAYGNEPAEVGTLLGAVLCEEALEGRLEEVVLVGSRPFFEAAQRAFGSSRVADTNPIVTPDVLEGEGSPTGCVQGNPGCAVS